jgi:predicted phage baseplate assembly protein
MPSTSEQEMLRRNFGGPDFIRPVTETGGPKGYWITWREVSTFHASTARDRHYILDHVTGEVAFGDDVCGMVPPILAGNIRMSHYRTGGGAMGNQAAQAIKQLVSAVPYVQKVVNWISASGGNDCEPAGIVSERGPREIRHGGRAVTFEDYEDLAARASRDVARVKCVPQSDLASDPTTRLRRLGLVSVVVVPRSTDAKPIPSLELLEQVKDFIDARRLATADLVVVGPEYVRVEVEAEIVIERPQEASEVEQRVDAALKAYLHPISGGPSRSGWEFGRLPQRSDLYVLIERIPGVSHIRDLTLTTVAERAGIQKTKHFLVYCGRHTLTMTL